MRLEDYKAPVKLKLAALWASLMFCYVYADFFGLFVAGRLADMNAGIMEPLGRATPTVLLATSLMMTVPSLMVFGALAMPARLSRWVNALLAGIYAGIIVLTMVGAPPFYLFFGTIEVLLSLTILFYAVKWPSAP